MIVAQEPRAPGAPRLTPSKEQLKQYLAQGLTQKQIAEKWEEDSGQRVTRNAITMAMAREGLTPNNPVPRYTDLLPWKVKMEHLRHYHARMLRAESRIRRLKTEKAKKADPDYRRLQSWKQDLADSNAVVMYDPETPDGFYWTYRQDGDDDIIRRPTATE